MLKLKPKNNVLATFLSQQALSPRELALLQTCGSDGSRLYWHQTYLCDIQHIQSTSIQVVPKRLWQLTNMTASQCVLLWLGIMIMGWLVPRIQPYLPEGMTTFIWNLAIIYLITDILITLMKQRHRPKQHYQLKLHTRFGEQHVFGQAEQKESLLLLEAWLHAHQAKSLPSDKDVL